jgi:hypothetical protein
MEDVNYGYWEIEYVSCEGNDRWTIARADADAEECEVRDMADTGTCGDEIARIISITETYDEDYTLDFSRALD